MLVKREIEYKNLKKTHDRQKSKYSDLQALFTDTLNVKLRYEEIIKNLMENEKKNRKNQKTVADIIMLTKPKTQVVAGKFSKSPPKEIKTKSVSPSKDRNTSCNSSVRLPRGKSVISISTKKESFNTAAKIKIKSHTAARFYESSKSVDLNLARIVKKC